MSTNSADENHGELRLSLAIEALYSGQPHAEDLRQSHFTFRFPIPTPALTPIRARSPIDNESMTTLPILESGSDTSNPSRADTEENQDHIFNPQYWLNEFTPPTPPSSRPQSVEPSPERRSRSGFVISELSISETNQGAPSSGRQELPTSRRADFTDRQSLQAISTDSGGQNSRSKRPDTNQPNNDSTITGHSNFPGIQNRTEDATSSAESGVKNENAEDGRPSSSISQTNEPGSRPIIKSVLDILNGLFIGFDLLARLAQFNERVNFCIANTQVDERCTRRVKQIDESVIERLLTLLSAPYETERLDSELLSLINLTLCGRSHRKDVQEFVEYLRRDPSIDSETTVAAVAACTGENQNRRRPKKNKARPTQATPQIPHYNLRSNPIPRINLPQFTRWQPANSRKLNVSTLVAKTMRKPLTSTEEKSGWLYVYWNQSNFDYRKIGCTTVDIAGRLKKWETQCQHRAEQVTQSSSQQEGPQVKKEEEKVPHVHRLEKLVHDTLKVDRYCEPCCAVCRKRHREWFDVKDHKIQSVISIWSEWIRREPYELVDDEGKWMLKAEFETEVDTICKKIEDLENETQQSQEVIRPGPRRRSERRRNEHQNANKQRNHLPGTRRSGRLQ